jgi:hypothetical protein
MSAEDHNRDPSTHVDPPVEEHNLDSLARGLASGSISRRQAVRWMGGALLGSVLAIVPGVEAFAAPQKPPQGRCPAGFVNCRGTCVKIESNPSHCGGCFIQCSPNEVCTSGQCCAQENACGSQCCGADEFCCDFGGGSAVCCPSGTNCAGPGFCCLPGQEVCGGQCVSTTCPEGQFFSPASCQCQQIVDGECAGGQQPCAGSFSCGANSECLCFLTAEGSHRCFQPTNCFDCLETCTNSSECPSGYACAVNCCGAKCYPLCGETSPCPASLSVQAQSSQSTGVKSG